MTHLTHRTIAARVGHRRLIVLVLSLLLATVTLSAARLAASTRGTPFAELVVDPYGAFSAVRYPSWPRVDLKFPAQLVAIDGAPLHTALTHDKVTKELADHLNRLRRNGQKHVALTFAFDGKLVTVRRNLRDLQESEIIFFYLFYALVGCAIFASGLVVYALAKRRAAARSYALWATGTGLFFATFYDYHSSAELTSWFTIGSLCTQLGFVWLAWSFPAPPALLTKTLRLLLVGVTVVGATAATALVTARWLPFDTMALRVAITAFIPITLFTLMAAVGFRFYHANPQNRMELRPAAIGLATVPALVGVGFVADLLFGQAIVHLVLPLLAPAIPLTIAYAIVRHDVLHTGALLKRNLLALPIVFLGLSCGVLVWLGARESITKGMMWLAPVLLAAVVAGLVIATAYRLAIRNFFPALREYRPTIDELSESLALLRDEVAIRKELRRLVLRWLPTQDVLVLTAAELAAAENTAHPLPISRETRRLPGPAEPPTHQSKLVIPMHFQEEVCGAFLIGAKAGGALFTSEDVALLETMAALGALALHHAATLRAVDELRHAEVEASRDERSLLVDTLSAEIAHELGHPLRYFRDIFEGRSPEAPLTDEELRFARSQVERMDRLLLTLETLEIPPPRFEPVVLREPVEHSVRLLSESLKSQGIRVRNDIPPTLVVQAEHDPLVQVFANLLRNAAQAAGINGEIGIRMSVERDELRLDIWDNGPGIADDIKSSLFRVWGVTTRRGGKGLGLMVTTRLLKHFHWDIDSLREQGETIFRITVPAGMGWSYEDSNCRRSAE